MNAKNEIVVSEREEVLDNMNTEEVISVSETELDTKKLADLKLKLAAKNGDKMAPRIVETRKHSISLGIIGSGQCGSRLASSLFDLGYPAVVCNTASQDLHHISNIPTENKLHLDYSLGGAAKELEIGREAAEAFKDQIFELVSTKLDSAQVLLFATSLGGGSGAGSAETIINLLSTIGKPVMVLTVLPSVHEDSHTKSNALQTLSRLSKLAQTKVISNLIVVDNARIESIYSDLSQLDFFGVSNKVIVEPLDIFNTLSSQPSSVKSLDPNELAKLFIDGDGLSVYGSMQVDNYTDDTAIAEAVINNLGNNLLASGFDLKKSKYVGVMIVANENVWKKVPASSVNYAMSMVSDLCSPRGIYKGIYTVPSNDDFVKVYSFWAGLGLPEERIEQLKKETQELTAKTKEKDEVRNLSLKLDTGVDENVSAADKIRQKIQTKSSAFGKLNKSVIDRRK